MKCSNSSIPARLLNSLTLIMELTRRVLKNVGTVTLGPCTWALTKQGTLQHNDWLVTLKWILCSRHAVQMNFCELLAKNMSNTVHLWLFTHIFPHGSVLLAYLREVCVKLATELLFILLLEISSEAPSSVWKILSINVIWFQWKAGCTLFPNTQQISERPWQE